MRISVSPIALLASSLAALALACSGMTEPNRPAPVISVSRTVPMSYPFPAPDVVSTTSSVAVTAILTTGTPCYTVSATDRIEGHELTINLIAKSRDVPCIQVTVTAQYTVTSSDVPMTVTHVRVQQTGFVGSDPVLVDTDIRGMI